MTREEHTAIVNAACDCAEETFRALRKACGGDAEKAVLFGAHVLGAIATGLNAGWGIKESDVFTFVRRLVSRFHGDTQKGQVPS